MLVEAAGVALSVHDPEPSADGLATVLVHGIGGTAWPVDELPGRVITYSRRGYGASGAPQPYERTTVSEQAEDLAAVVRARDAAPAVLVGAGLGALIVLDVVLRHAALVHAAVLLDPPAYMFVPSATEALSEQRRAMEAELRAGGPAAIEEARSRIVDFGALATLPLGYGNLGEVSVPVAIVSTDAAQPHDLAAAEALLDAIPTALGASSLVDGVARVR
ncbi:MAG TPA: alpha/beta hydrolase [Solirubrobacteraceae bacterium]|nr:alpha/beta hydrolase [Solirubrobacteraceae bacterium]